ncbi:MAG: hypothetical protein M1823_003354 [Watsoniomyces obsoletus]|nr:MAG: hypothetical protein M1823_003354 [Watsoniomyces obsoletus]
MENQQQSTDAQVNIFRVLPHEIIRNILIYLPVPDIARARQATREIDGVASDPTLWRTCCLADFSFWNAEHGLEEVLRQPVSLGEWEDLYAIRLGRNRGANGWFDNILQTRTHHIEHINILTGPGFGYDLKDLMLKFMASDLNVGDGLARRFWGGRVLGLLHRQTAVDQWIQLLHGDLTTEALFKSMTALSMFLPMAAESDLDVVSAHVDLQVKRFLDASPNWTSMSTRGKALALNRFVRTNVILGRFPIPPAPSIPPAAGVVSLNTGPEINPVPPIISVSSFCVMAERLKMDARPVLFPYRARVIVFPPHGIDLNGRVVDEDELGDESVRNMYLDPYGSDDETPVEELRHLLGTYSDLVQSPEASLRPTPVGRLLIICAINIYRGVREHRRHEYNTSAATAGFSITTTTSGHQLMNIPSNPIADNTFAWCHNGHENLDGAYYGALWVMIIMGNTYTGDMEDAGFELMDIIGRFHGAIKGEFPEDAILLRKHMMGAFQSTVHSRRLIASATEMVAEDGRIRDQHPRSDAQINVAVLYRVGQMFRHRRYGYIAVIVGWDEVCKANEAWVRRMDVDNLPGGRTQSFYHVIGEDKSARYVAQENIELITNMREAPASMIPWIGRYFKRWDAERGQFESNLEEEYPDD